MTVFGQTASPPLSDHWGVRASLRADHEAAATTDTSAFEQVEEESPKSYDMSVHGTDNSRKMHAAHTSHDGTCLPAGVAGRGHQGRGSEASEAPELTVKTALAWIPPPQDWAPLQVSQWLG